MSDARIVEVDDNTGRATYRASAVYSCFNALLMARLGYDGADAPEWLQVRFNAGHDHEPLILKKLTEEFGFNFIPVPEGQEQHETGMNVGSSARILGHMDALHASDANFPISVTHVNGDGTRDPRIFNLPDGELVVIDAKALAVSTFANWERDRFKAFPYYAWQQRVYMLGTGATGLVMAVKNKNTDELLVEYFTDTYMDDIVRKADIVKKILGVEAAAKRGNEAIFETECTPMFPCPYFQWHPNKPKEGEIAASAELETLVARRTLLKHESDDLQKNLEVVDEQIRTMAEGRETTTKTKAGTLTTYHSGYSTVAWDAIGEAMGMSSDAAKEMFTVAKKSEKLSVKVTVAKPRGKK